MCFFINLSTSYAITIKKCCAASERYDVETQACVPNVNGVPHKINFTSLIVTKQGWISNFSSGIPFYIQKPEICKGILKTESNYRVTQEGKLVNFVGDNQSYYEFYNDFCVDVDHKSSESIAIICENQKVIKKCCEKTMKLQESHDGEFSCHQTDEPIFLNDISEIFTPDGKSSENYEFSKNSIESFGDFLKVYNFSADHFKLEGNILSEFKNETDFCLEKIDDRWIVLLKNENNFEVFDNIKNFAANINIYNFLTIVTFILILIIIIILLIIIWLILKAKIPKCHNECKLMGNIVHNQFVA
jgi:hypothetical protein